MSWRGRPWAWAVHYQDHAAVDTAVARLRELPPLVTSGEIERLRTLIADAQQGKRFVLQGGDCAETLAECTSASITSKLKILLQMSMSLTFASKRPVVRIGRWAGQYAKPRSSGMETRKIDGESISLPSYFGDLVNRAEFTPEARRADPALMIEGYKHSALTLNFVRSLMEAGLGDVHHPERWELGFLSRAGLSTETRERYQRLMGRIGEGIRFLEAISEREIDALSRGEFFASHEALNLYYEEAQTREVPRRTGWWNLTTHLPWVGERTRALDGPHVEYLRGIRNPIGVKLGPSSTVEQVVAIIRTLNPTGEAGKIVLIARLGASNVRRMLPTLIQGARLAGSPVLWVCDPMHGNLMTTGTGIKTRDFAHVMDELLTSWDVHAECGSHLGGIHIELTGDDVTECLGGAANLTEQDLTKRYQTLCDPRLNYEQSMELAMALAERMER